MRMKLSKLHIILLLWLSVVCFGACHKTPTRMETILCKDNNFWCVYSLDTAQNVYYPHEDCFTFYKNNKFKQRNPLYFFGGRPYPDHDLDWYYYPFLKLLQLGEYKIKVLKFCNDTIVYTDITDYTYLLINVGEEYANKERPEFPANQPVD